MQFESSTIATQFFEDWSKHHEGRQPLGWFLRQDAALHWVRFHALPSSKRYAETEAEMASILSRGNCLAGELLGENVQCWIISARADELVGPGEMVGNWSDPDDGPNAPRWHYFIRKGVWSHGNYDRELRDIANDGPYYPVWFDGKAGSVFAPYDGGFDLFANSAETVRAFKRRHPEWLSDREDGL